jgi:Cupin-like domain
MTTSANRIRCLRQTPGPELSASEWDEFIENNWEQRGKLLQFQVPIASEAEAFQILVDGSENYRKDGKFRNLKFFIKGRELLHDVKIHLPTTADGDLDGYLQRLEAMHPGEDFMLFLNEISRYDPTLCDRVQCFLYPLFDRIGLPSGPVDVEIFMGQYKNTPGSIHRATCHNFHFTVRGNKRFPIWPPAAARAEDCPVGEVETGSEQYLSTTDLDWRKELREDFYAVSGQATYCPSMYWHVGCAPEFCLCVNVSVYTTKWAERVGEEFLRQRIQEQSNREERSEGNWSKELEAVYQAFVAGTKRELVHEALSEAWLRHRTGLGIAGLPSLQEVESLDEEQLLQLVSASGVLWRENLDRTLTFSANGYSAKLAMEPVQLSVLEHINTRVPFTPRGLAKAYGGTKAQLEGILTQLKRMRALA